MSRRKLQLDVRRRILHEAGYRCGNPACRTILTLDLHHLTPVSNDGADDPDNLLALCPTCHSLHHAGHIPEASLRAWKHLLIALNESVDRRSLDLLLLVHKTPWFVVSADGLIEFAGLVAADLVQVDARRSTHDIFPRFDLKLSARGQQFVDGWLRGDQRAALLGPSGSLANEIPSQALPAEE